MIGTYVLVTYLKKNSEIKIGKLGNIDFPKGYYCYVGSAFGKTVNLKNRIGRYKKLLEEKKGNLKWHIDYFLVNPNTSFIKTFILNNKKIECEISQKLEDKAKETVRGFGSSDCNCKGHFHYFKTKQNFEKILEGLT